MSMSDFDIAVALVLGLEGERGQLVTDPGGLTKWGIASRWYPEVLRADFSRADAVAIYRRQYWDRCACDLMPAWLALMIFDSAVQHAPGTAIMMLQRALGVQVDGLIGKATRAAIAQAGPGSLGSLIDQRLGRYLEQSRDEWAESGRGWMRRLITITRECLVRLQHELAP